MLWKDNLLFSTDQTLRRKILCDCVCVSETRTTARQKESWHAGHLIGRENEFGVAYDGMNFNKAHEACDTGQILSGNLISLLVSVQCLASEHEQMHLCPMDILMPTVYYK